MLTPAHLTIARRESVGLPGDAGLLVRTVTPGSPAAQAEIRPGDVLLAAGGHALRSIASMYAAVREAGAAPLKVEIVRGADRVEVALAVPAVPVDGPPTGRAVEHAI